MIETAPTSISPFRGKRGLFREADKAEQEIDRLAALVDNIMESWKKHGADCGITLQIEPRSKKLRWRATVKHFKHQKNIEFDGEEMRQIRDGLSEAALTMLIGFEHRRLVLNMKLVVARVSLTEHRNYVAKAKALEDCAPESLKPAFPSQKTTSI